ncbi:MAG TPA: hypothetical protein VGM13_04465 [Thermoanaerobaculia bacterium]
MADGVNIAVAIAKSWGARLPGSLPVTAYSPRFNRRISPASAIKERRMFVRAGSNFLFVPAACASADVKIAWPESTSAPRIAIPSLAP